MTETRVAKSWGKGCFQQALLVALVALIFLAGFIGLVVISISLPLTAPQRVYFWVGGFAGLLVITIVGIFWWGNHLIRGRANLLDAAFIPLGLAGRGYLWNGRQYHGLVNGRQVDVYFYRGPNLDIYLAAQINTRMGVGLKGTLSRMASRMINRPELHIPQPELAQLGFYPLD